MNRMTAKEYLMQYQDICNSIATKEERIIRLRAMAESTTARPSKIHVQSNTENKLERIFIQIEAIEESMQNQINVLVAKGEDIERAIDSLENNRYKEILRYRYLCNKRFEEISCISGYDYFYTCRLHGEALIEIEKRINNHKKECDIMQE